VSVAGAGAPRDAAAEAEEQRFARPFDGIDDVLRRDATGIAIVRSLSPDEAIFEGHYPGHAVLPGVFVIEAVHQAVRRFVDPERGRPRLQEVRSARFREQVRPGDRLVCDCRCVAAGADGLEVEARCHVAGRLSAEVRLRYRIEGPDA
jgi:3-hydroxyacyl-[acyl-carrier-protein] dehydratase